MRRTDILLALVDQRSPSLINTTATLRAKSNLNMTHPLASELGRVLDPDDFKAAVLTAAHNGDLPEVARLLSMIDDADEDAL